MTAPALVEGDVLVLAETLTHAVAAAMNLGYSRKYVSGLATLDRVRGLTLRHVVAVGLSPEQVSEWLHRPEIAPAWIAADPFVLEFVR